MSPRYSSVTHKTILEVANQLFIKHGYLETSTRRIAKEVGITQPNLYYYYKNKESLYVAIVETELEKIGHHLDEMVISHQEDFHGALMAMARYLIYEHLIDLNMMLHDLENHISEESQWRLYSLWKEKFQGPFIRLFIHHQEHLRGSLTPEKAARHFFILLSPYINTNESRYKESFTVEEIMDVYLHGVLDKEIE